MSNKLNIGIYTPVPAGTVIMRNTPGVTTGDLPDYESLKFTTQSPGGCGTATFRYELPYPYRGKEVMTLNARVEIYDNAGLVWRGRIQQLGRDDQAGVITYDVTALGYAASLQDQLFSFGFEEGTTIEGAIKDILSITTGSSAQPGQYFPVGGLPEPNSYFPGGSFAPTSESGVNMWQINNADFSDIEITGTVMRGGMSPFQGKTFQWILGELCKYGDQYNNPLFWHVWEGPPGSESKPSLELISQPTTPEYFISLQDGAHPKLQQDLTRVWNNIVVLYGYKESTNAMVDGATSMVVSDQGSIYTLGILRTGVILTPRVYPTTLGQLDAVQIASTALTKFAYPQWIGQSITIPETTPIQSVSYGELVPWRVKAGRNCVVREYVTGVTQDDISNNVSNNQMFYIAKTEWDDDSRTLTITPEGQESLDVMVGRYLADARYS